MSEQKLTIEDVIRHSDLSENLQKTHIEFCHFLKDNEFTIEPEGHTEDDKNGWKIIYMNECVGHMNFANVGIWIDTCDFGSSGSADDVLKETTWAHVRICEHFSSGGKQCGCGNQPGFDKVIFGKKYTNLCFALLEFVNPDAKTFENIKKLMLLFKRNKSNVNERLVELQKVSEETMCFMRGKYKLDEVGNGKDELKFRIGGKTVLTILIREDRFDFVIIFGKAEREKFEQERGAYPKAICDIYDGTKTYHDGKWMLIPVADLDTLEGVKRLIMIKKKPNRKPFPKETAVISKCGHRCDLCIHYSGGTISEEFRKELYERLSRVFSAGDWMSMRCPGCYKKPKNDVCQQLQCAKSKGIDKCLDCKEYHCSISPAISSKIEAKSILADDVTWAILPYVHDQYGN